MAGQIPTERHRIALIADAHLHDPDGDFGGAGVMIAGRRRALMNWSAVRTNARAVNESKAALLAALDRIAARGIRTVVLAGDYSDEGQAENLRRLEAILHDAEARLGLRFYAIPGNHDAYAVGGKHRAIRFATGPHAARLVTSDPALPDAVLSPAMFCPGLPDALAPMAAFGQRRRPTDLHWESPFGLSDRATDRMYRVTSPDGTATHTLLDASYLVEPEPGLWLLMLDANVFVPRAGIADARRKRAFHDPADAGWTAVLHHKPFLLDWIADVTARADRMGKLLIPVSHYPVLPPWPGLDRVLPHGSLMRRAPVPQVATALVHAGLRLHLGGHLHINAVTTVPGLTDVSLPATCAFPAAATVLEGDRAGLTIDRIDLADLPLDPVAAALYAAEGAPQGDTSFGAFLAARYRDHALARRLQRDLPPGIWPAVSTLRLRDLPGRIGAPPGAVTLPDQPLTDVLCDLLALLAGSPVAPDRPALLRGLAGLTGQGRDPVARWLIDALALLGTALDRAATSDPVLRP